ncbi:hypothetical protein [Polaromonas sp. OV174]|nr:hypothetical protein [Polaromonas sp. OV174]
MAIFFINKGGLPSIFQDLALAWSGSKTVKACGGVAAYGRFLADYSRSFT